MDTQPLRAVDREMVPLLCHVKRKMAEYIKCDATDVFLTENCSAGINTILRSLEFGEGDAILTLSLGYGKLVELDYFIIYDTLLLLRICIMLSCTEGI